MPQPSPEAEAEGAEKPDQAPESEPAPPETDAEPPAPEDEAGQDLPPEPLLEAADEAAADGATDESVSASTDAEPSPVEVKMGGEEVDEAPVEVPTPVIEAEAEGEVPAPAEWLAEDVEPLPEMEDDFFWREEAEALEPAAPDTVVAERYVLIEAMDVQEDEILYLADDLGRCWQCDYEGNDPDDAFCAQCGASLAPKPEVHLLEVQSAEAEPSSGAAVLDRLAHEGRTFLLLADAETRLEPEPPAAPPALSLHFGQCSDPGQVRELNEDSTLVLLLEPTYESQTGPVQCLFAVADGMGGHEGGEVASRLALQVLVERVMRTILIPGLNGELALEDDVVVLLRQATMAANDAVYLARQKAGNDMGTTLTTVYIRDNRLFLAHVGDCRVYRWNAAGLEQLTADHSVVASMIANGQASPEEIYTHPHRSVIYRCVGDKPLVEVDTDLLPLDAGDRLVLCSDGLWEMIRSQGVEDVLLQEADPQAACDLMVSRANAAGGDDNISVIVVQVVADSG
jgi:serine/threonine protein phosphatase PrpC